MGNQVDADRRGTERQWSCIASEYNAVAAPRRFLVLILATIYTRSASTRTSESGAAILLFLDKGMSDLQGNESKYFD